EPRIAQPAVPIELHRPVDVAVVDQQLGRWTVSGGRLDRILEGVGIIVATVHRLDLRTDRDPRVECRAVPQHATDLAVISDREPARISEVAVLARLLGALDPLS